MNDLHRMMESRTVLITKAICPGVPRMVTRWWRQVRGGGPGSGSATCHYWYSVGAAAAVECYHNISTSVMESWSHGVMVTHVRPPPVKWFFRLRFCSFKCYHEWPSQVSSETSISMSIWLWCMKSYFVLCDSNFVCSKSWPLPGSFRFCCSLSASVSLCLSLLPTKKPFNQHLPLSNYGHVGHERRLITRRKQFLDTAL